MDYLFINAIVNEIYTDIPSISDFPKSCRENVVRISQSLDCLSPNAPDHVFGYYSVAGGPAPVLVMSRVQKHTNCSSVGRLTQCQGWNFNTDLILDHIGQLFSTGFYTEAEVAGMARSGGNVPLTTGRFNPIQPDLPELSVPVKTAILSVVFQRWLRGTAPLRIAVPSQADYDSFVLGAVRAIYALFPAAMRVEAGFCSFLPDVNNCPREISLGFIPEILSDSETLKLDGSNIGNRGIANTSRRTLDRFVEHLASLEPMALKTYLREVNRDLEGCGSPEIFNTVTAKSYGTLGEVLKLLSLEGPQMNLIPAWINFYANQTKYPEACQLQIRKKIRASIKIAEFCHAFSDYCQGTADEIFAALPQFMPICRDNPELCPHLREYLLNRLGALALTGQQIYDRIYAAPELQPLFPAEVVHNLYLNAAEEAFQQLKSQSISAPGELDWAEQQAGNLLQMIRTSGVPGTEALQARLEQYQAGLMEARQSAVSKKFLAQLNQLKSRQSATAAELQNVIGAGKTLLAKIQGHPLRASLSQTEEDVAAFIREKEEALTSSSVQFSKLLQDLQMVPSYFHRLEIASQRRDAVTDENQLKELQRSLSFGKPGTLNEFAAQFKARYGEPMTLDAIARRPQLEAAQIIRDLGSLSCLTLNLSEKKLSREQMIDRIHTWEALARVLRSNCPVQVSYQDFSNLDSKWFLQVLNLSQNVTDEYHILRELVNALAKAGVFNEAELDEFRQAHPSFRRGARKSGRKKLWIILVSCLAALLVIIGGIVAFLMLKNDPVDAASTEPAATTEPVQTTHATHPTEARPQLPEAQEPEFRILAKQGALIALLYPEDIENGLPQKLCTGLDESLNGEQDVLIQDIYSAYQKLRSTGSVSPERYITCRYWLYQMQRTQDPEAAWNAITEGQMNDLLSILYYKADPADKDKQAGISGPGFGSGETTDVHPKTDPAEIKASLLEIMKNEKVEIQKAYLASVENTRLLQTLVDLFGADGSRTFDDHLENLKDVPEQPLEQDLLDHGIAPWTEETGVSREVYCFWAGLVEARNPDAEGTELNDALAPILQLMSAKPQAPGADPADDASDDENKIAETPDSLKGAEGTEGTEASEESELTLEQTIEPARKAFDEAKAFYGLAPDVKPEA